MRVVSAIAAATCVLIGMALVAFPAEAELPPQVYQQARDSAGTVVVLRVQHVRRLQPDQTEGICVLTGEITRVERGSAQEGQAVVLPVPCISPAWQPIPGPFPGYRDDLLGQATRVRVFMTNGALVRRGLDMLD